MSPSDRSQRCKALIMIPVVVLTAGLIACGSQTTPGISPSQPTLASLAADNERLRAEMAALETRQAGLEVQISSQGVILSYLATIMPTPLQRSEASAGFEGSVMIEGGTCCVGATAGETVNIHVAYQANSPYAGVTEMRVRAGGGGPFSELDLAEESWIPFVASQTIPFGAPINWVGFYVAVQYRDALGNLSPLYTDDISVEGMPPMPG